jgi:hypothetical protein
MATIEGLVRPRTQASLRDVWKAFLRGDTWERVGRKSRKVARFRHKRYKGKIRLEWWGKALRFAVEDTDSSGRIAGAFLGHVQRHGRSTVDRLDMEFG